MSGETTRRTVRIEDGLWDEAQLLAREAGDNLSEVIRVALREYVIEHRDQPLQAAPTMISEEALKAAAWEISAVHYPDYEPDLELARKVLEAAAPHMLAPVIALANDWEERGERDIADSKTFEDEGIAMAFLTEGANKVEAARHIHNALNTNPYRSQP